VSAVPEPLQRLNVLLDALAIAHVTIYDLRTRLVSEGSATPRSEVLLAESVHIVLNEAPKASAAARRLASLWHEQSVLDPEAAGRTALALDEELTRTESALRVLLSRERAIAVELRALAAGGP
jgi:hypothetical protein